MEQEQRWAPHRFYWRGQTFKLVWTVFTIMESSVTHDGYSNTSSSRSNPTRSHSSRFGRLKSELWHASDTSDGGTRAGNPRAVNKSLQRRTLKSWWTESWNFEQHTEGAAPQGVGRKVKEVYWLIRDERKRLKAMWRTGVTINSTATRKIRC